ncbi:hypothetical protein ABZ322_41710, partial [Streptomyces sp. NPDC006129]
MVIDDLVVSRRHAEL